MILNECFFLGGHLLSVLAHFGECMLACGNYRNIVPRVVETTFLRFNLIRLGSNGMF